MLCVMVLTACDKKDDDLAKAKGNIHGLVTDFTNANTPIAGASVTLNYRGMTKTTGSDGRFEFTNVEPGTYTIQVMANNYQTTTKQVTVVANQYATCDFQLTKGANSIDFSTMSLSFAKEISQLSFTVTNNSSNQLSYSITNVPDYLTLSSTSGIIAARGNIVIMVTVNNRSSITSNRSGQMVVTVNNTSYPISVTVEETSSSGSGGSGSGGNSGGSGNSADNVTRGLLVYYNFNSGNANNSYGSTNNGTVQGDASSYITDTPSGTGKALSLGSRNYVRVPSNILRGLNSFSISMWVKDFGSGALFTSTFSDDWFNGAPRLFVNGSNTFMADGCAEIFNSSESLGISASSYQSSGWHMLTATYGNKKISLYIDGALVSSITHYNNTEGYGNLMTIGGHANDWWNSSMKVDNVRIYDVVLSATEVASIYAYEK